MGNRHRSMVNTFPIPISVAWIAIYVLLALAIFPNFVLKTS